MDEEKPILVEFRKIEDAIALSTFRTTKEKKNLELTIDEVIEGYVGSLGFAQVVHVFLVSLAWIFDSQNTLVTIFTDAQPSSWRCRNPHSAECFGVAGSTNSSSVVSVCGLAPGIWEWVGGNKSSVIAEWSLVCDRKFLAAIPPSFYFLGSLIGSAVYGRLSDKHLGRKKTILLSCILTSATAFLTSLSTNIWTYAFLRFTNGLSRSGIGICCLVLSTEVVGRKWRGQVGQYGFFFFTAGFLSLPLIAYPNRTHWRNIYRLISFLPLLYSVFVLPFVSESPRWLLIKNRNREALDVLRKFARLNGKSLPDNLTLLNPSAAAKTIIYGEEGEIISDRSLWNTRWAAKRMIIVMIAGFGVGFIYYGIQLNVENLNFNLYYTVALNAVMEIPAVFLGSVLLGFTNRRLIFSQSAYIAGISCFLCILFTRGNRSDGSSSGSWSQLIFEGIGFMAASTAFDVLYVYCVELFPTNVRNVAVSMLRQSLMLGASLSPLLVVMGRLTPSVSFLVFGLLSILSGLASIWLPETRNAPLYETLEQQEEEEKHSYLANDHNGLELGI